MYVKSKAAKPGIIEKQQPAKWNIPAIDMINTGQNIMKLRKQRSMSVRDLQDIFGFSTPQAIYKWERGTALPSLDNLVVLAVVFQVSIDQILALEVTAQELLGA